MQGSKSRTDRTSDRRQTTTSAFVGTWSYRSFINNPDLPVDFNDLRFGAGTMALEEPNNGTIVRTVPHSQG